MSKAIIFSPSTIFPLEDVFKKGRFSIWKV
jgi:hypothetical protein